jgi:hypothetical protein
MRRVLPAILICCSMTFPALAQRGGRGGGGSHGGGHASGMRGSSFGHGGVSGGFRGSGFGHGGISGGFRGSGFRGTGFHDGGFGHRPGFRSGFGFQRFPRIYPLFYGGLGYYGYYDPFWYSSPGDYPYSGYNSDYNYPAAQAQPVIINQDFQTEPALPPVVREYTAPGPPAPTAAVQRKYDTPLYLIAFNDGVIRAVLAYWAEGSSLHYVTMEHAQKQVALASINRGLSERLNDERNVTFQLPR